MRTAQLARWCSHRWCSACCSSALWELLVAAFDIKPYFLVPPSDILGRFLDNFDLIWAAMRVSGTNALIGLLVGAALGVAMSFVLLRFQLLDEIVTPLSIALNAVPIFVLVAVFNNMFAITSEVPRRLMVTLVVFFVVLVNVARGLRQVDATHVELMQSYAASDWTVLRQVRVPERDPVLLHGAQDRRAARRHHRLRVRVLRRLAERARQQDHLQPRDLEEGRGLGIRRRRLPARARLLPDRRRVGDGRHPARAGDRAERGRSGA